MRASGLGSTDFGNCPNNCIEGVAKQFYSSIAAASLWQSLCKKEAAWFDTLWRLLLDFQREVVFAEVNKEKMVLIVT